MEGHRKVNFRRLGTNQYNSDSGKTEKMIVVYQVSVGFAARDTGVRVNQVNIRPTIPLFLGSVQQTKNFTVNEKS